MSGGAGSRQALYFFFYFLSRTSRKALGTYINVRQIKRLYFKSRQQTLMFCNSVSGWVDNDTHCASVNAGAISGNVILGTAGSEKPCLSMWFESHDSSRVMNCSC